MGEGGFVVHVRAAVTGAGSFFLLAGLMRFFTAGFSSFGALSLEVRLGAATAGEHTAHQRADTTYVRDGT